jgi:hypothetical protein
LSSSIDIPSTSIKNSSQSPINLLLDPARQTGLSVSLQTVVNIFSLSERCIFCR